MVREREEHHGSSSSSHYEIIEEECLETLSDDGVQTELIYSTGGGEYDEEEEEFIEYVEEEVLESTPTLPGISEGDEEEVDDEEVIEEDEEEVEEEYEEVEVAMNGSQSVFSGTEFVEELVMDDEEEEEEEEVFEEFEYMEQSCREGSEDGSIRELLREQSLRSNSNHSTAAKYDASVEEDENPEDDDDDGASAEELTEAIEYVLRQERAVSKFILTESQAAKMAHLPIPVMKIIVDHLEICDNESTPIDWDFLLKIVLPFCENEAD